MIQPMFYEPARDLPVVEGCVIFLAFVFVMVNLLVDISYAWIDPRIRLDGGRDYCWRTHRRARGAADP